MNKYTKFHEDRALGSSPSELPRKRLKITARLSGEEQIDSMEERGGMESNEEVSDDNSSGVNDESQEEEEANEDTQTLNRRSPLIAANRNEDEDAQTLNHRSPLLAANQNEVKGRRALLKNEKNIDLKVKDTIVAFGGPQRTSNACCYTENLPSSSGTPSCRYLWCLVFVLPLLGVVLANSYFSDSNIASNEKTTLRLRSFLEQMKLKYPNQPFHTFKQFSRLVDISNNSSRREDLITVITILHNDTHTTGDSIARDMALYAAQKFHSAFTIHELYGSSIPGYFGSKMYINNLKDILTTKGAMLIYDFDKINSNEARKFGAICNKYTPFVDAHVVFVLVLKTPLLKHDNNLSIQELKDMARLTMETLWEDMEETSLRPLIVRLTDFVFQIKS